MDAFSASMNNSTPALAESLIGKIFGKGEKANDSDYFIGLHGGVCRSDDYNPDGSLKGNIRRYPGLMEEILYQLNNTYKDGVPKDVALDWAKALVMAIKDGNPVFEKVLYDVIKAIK